MEPTNGAHDDLRRTVVSLRDICLAYPNPAGPVEVLKDINFDIREGEFICMLGPSGCGKSTLLKIIAGLLEKTSGSADFLGEPIEGPDWHRGVVFQTPVLYPWLNVRDNVAFGPRMRGVPAEDTDRAVERAIQLVSLEGFGDHKPYDLSGGMRQRASLARTLVSNPDLILMDEPFGALDAFTRLNMQRLIRNIWLEKKNTVFLITHDVDEALSLATRIVVMSTGPGQIVQEFPCGFTYEIAESASNDVRYSPEYGQLREKCLELINRHHECPIHDHFDVEAGVGAEAPHRDEE